MATISDGVEHVAAGPDVGEHVWVAEDGYGRLGIEQNPVGVNAGNSVGKHETVLEKSGASDCRAMFNY